MATTLESAPLRARPRQRRGTPWEGWPPQGAWSSGQQSGPRVVAGELQEAQLKAAASCLRDFDLASSSPLVSQQVGGPVVLEELLARPPCSPPSWRRGRPRSLARCACLRPLLRPKSIKCSSDDFQATSVEALSVYENESVWKPRALFASPTGENRRWRPSVIVNRLNGVCFKTNKEVNYHQMI